MTNGRARPSGLLMIVLLVLEAGLVGAALLLHRRGTTPFPEFARSRAGLAAGAALVVCLAAAIVAALLARSLRAGRARDLRWTLALNGIAVLGAAMAAEGALRLAAEPSPRGVALLGTELLPYSWERVVERNRESLRRASPHGAWEDSYLVPHPTLGWTVGAGRRSADGLHSSSPEGISSASPTESFAGRTSGRRVVVLIGDSHTFSLDVAYPDSWGHGLQRLLGDGYLVLNFAVNGYGIDQALLRYELQAREWKPELVLFGVANHDLQRTMSVYTFLTFPTWDIPFSKPRFALRDGALALVHEPGDDPAAWFDRPRIGDLPALDYEPGYDPAEWATGPTDHSLLARLLLTRFRTWSGRREPVSRATSDEVNAALFRRFARDCAQDGTQGALVYLPTAGGGDFADPGAPPEPQHGQAKRVLSLAGADFVDLTEALRELPAGARFAEGKVHYSVEGNRVVAERLAPFVKSRLP